MTYGEAANLAVNQTLMRSINTSVIALLPVAGLLFVGAGLLGVGTLKDLALVLFVGLAAGAYSSIFLATPIAGRPQGARARGQALRQRVLARRASAAHATAAGHAVPTGPVASARRARGRRARPAVAVAERELPGQVARRRRRRVADLRSGASRGRGATATPRPGARPQRPGRSGRPGARSAGDPAGTRRRARRSTSSIAEPVRRRAGLPRAGRRSSGT